MRVIYIRPREMDDALVNGYSLKREKGDGNWLRFLENIEKQQGIKVEEQIEFTPDVKFNKKTEVDILDGSFGGQVYFQERLLEAHLTDLRYLTEDKDCLVVADLGNSLACLYLAYFTALRGIPLISAFHNDETKNFSIGGRSVYAQTHPYLRRKLVETVIKRSAFVLVENEGIATAVASLLPQLDHTFTIDPIAPVLVDVKAIESVS